MSKNQSQHYDNISKEYQEHYFDRESKYYRSRIFIQKFKKHLNESIEILDVGCGDGSIIEILEENGIKGKNYTGLDVSFNNTELFKNKFKGKYKVLNDNFAKKNLNLNKKFDAILLIGVIHHMYLDIENVFENLFNHLKVGGKIIIVEPNGSFLNFIRNYWYKKDKYFEENSERALKLSEIDKTALKKFEKIFYEYQGSVGYFVILQSMILRTPKVIKKYTYKFLTFFDALISKFNSKHLSSSYIIIYKKKSPST